MDQGQEAGLCQPAGAWHRVRVTDGLGNSWEVSVGPGAWLSVNSSELGAGGGNPHSLGLRFLSAGSLGPHLMPSGHNQENW